MQNTKNSPKLCSRRNKKNETTNIIKGGVTMRLLEKYKPSEGSHPLETMKNYQNKTTAV